MASDNDQTDVPERAVRVHRLTTLFVWAVLLVLFLQFFPAAKIIVLGVLAAASLAAAMRPIMVRVPGRRAVRGTVAGLIPAIVFAAALVSIGWAMKGPIQREVGNWPEAKQRLNGLLQRWGGQLGMSDMPDVDALLGQAREALVDQQVLSTTTNALAAVLVALAFVFFGSIFILIEREKCFLEPLEPLLPSARRPQLSAFVEDLEPKLRWWLIGTLISMIVIGVLSAIGYSLVGLQFAIPLAILSAVAEIVPTVGPMIAFGVALLFGLSQGMTTAVGVTIVYVLMQTIESYLLVPMVMKKSVKIPPVVTLFSVVFWGKVFGVAGLLLAIPLNLVVWSALKCFVGEKAQARNPGG